MLKLNNGNVLIVWGDSEQDGSGWGVYAKVIDGSGNTVKSEFIINEYKYGDQGSRPNLKYGQ